MINKNFELVKKQGVKFQFGIDENFSIEELKKQYDYIVLAIGAWKPGKLSLKDGKLVCEEMTLGERDTTGRRNTVSNGKTVMLDADTVIVAVGEKIDSELLVRNGIELDSKGFPKINETCETSIRNVYVAGNVKKGPATIVKGISDGKAVAKNILEKEGVKNDFEKKAIIIHENQIYERKGILKDSVKDENEANRCLSCNNICELCVDVCPNRANVVIKI